MKYLLPYIVLALLACSTTAGGVLKEAPTWRMVLAAGDGSIKAFDNAVGALKNQIGMKKSVVTLTSRLVYPGADMFLNIKTLEEAMTWTSGQCILYITSHGRRDAVRIGSDMLTPQQLDLLLTKHCPKSATVIVSACYSGIFTAPVMQKPERIILTASHAYRPSFGCKSDSIYTFWDGCMLRSLPTSLTWLELHEKTAICVQKLEAELPVLPSMPQFFRGDKASDLIPR